MQPSPLPPLFDRLPLAFSSAFDTAQPWRLLDEPLQSVLAQLVDRIEISLSPEFTVLGSGVVIERGVRVGPGAVLEGPLWIGRDVDIRPGAYLRGGVWIGERCVIGAHCEIKSSILFPGSRAPHLNYVGDSILGSDVNLGAGTILSNFRHDGREIRIPGAGLARDATGRRKLGAVLGDRVKTGCNCVLNPGTVVGCGTHLYPGLQLRSGVYPANSVVKLRQEIEIVAVREPSEPA